MARPFTRRKFLVGLGAATTAAAGASYLHWGEPHWLEVTQRTVDLAAAPGARPVVRLLQLSDFHASEFVSLEFIAESITLGLASRPDLIVLTGDFFTARYDERDRYAAILRRLSAAAPTLACLGNHDGGSWVRHTGGYATTAEILALLQAAEIPCLQNEGRELTLRGRMFQVIGVGDFWSGQCQPALAFARVPPRGAATRLVLNHNPDAKDLLQPHDWDLMLCGHTHGGQLRLPLIGTPFAPVVDRRYVEGLHRWDNRWLYVTRGVGNLHGLRFNCRPEVSVLELT